MKIRLVYLIAIMTLGVIFILLPYLFNGPINWADLSKSVGYTLFVLASLQVMEMVLEGPLEKKPDPVEQRFGLSAIYKTRAEIEQEIAQKLQRGKKIKLMSVALAGNAEMYHVALQENLAKAERNHPHIQVILMAGDAEALYQRAVMIRRMEFDKKTDPLFAQWVANISLIKNMEREYKGKIAVRLNSYYPLDPVFIIDEELYLTPYMFGRMGISTSCFHFVRKGHGSTYDQYEEAFDQFWEFLGKNTPGLSPNASDGTPSTH